MKFPVGILPSPQYTLFYVARYNGPTRYCIFQGSGWWLSGFYGGKAGGAHHSACGWITETIAGNIHTDLHGSDWVIGSDRSNSFRSNGVDRTTNDGASCSSARIAINSDYSGGQFAGSDFAIQSMLVYNVKLSDADVHRVEAWLNALQPAFTPANLQARARHETP
jgi:hypothetical protein